MSKSILPRQHRGKGEGEGEGEVVVKFTFIILYRSLQSNKAPVKLVRGEWVRAGCGLGFVRLGSGEMDPETSVHY